MSVRVVARIRPLLKLELDKDVIVTSDSIGKETPGSPTIVRIPNPKNEAESYSFQFNSVYDQNATQQEIFDHEVAPTVKHLFNGFDVTLFAYGVTGTGKTHTMRGGKSLQERGVIPRLLSSIYRRCRKIEKDSAGATGVEVAMSYYEIYNDRVYDLFEAPEKRTPAGLPIRDNNGKTVVVGLTERPCTTLKEFEKLYDEANVNRSTSATKLNAHSSRSHAILCVKITQTTETQTRISYASAIDLAGSEDNRRTDNNKERLVESSAINKSLFVLAQCVEAISKKQSRIPYRESKMTRILSLGQNNGLTVMILNLAPVRSYHQDTLSSLNFANRTRKIEVNEIENEPIFKTAAPTRTTASIMGGNIQRQPLKPLAASMNVNLLDQDKKVDKPVKAFSVYSDKSKQVRPSITTVARRSSPGKRARDTTTALSSRPTKVVRPSETSRFGKTAHEPTLSKASIEEMIERRIEEKLAEKALRDEHAAPAPLLPEDLQKRLHALEQRIEKKEDSRAEGLQYLLMAKQHQVRGEESSALKMYQLALPYFPENEKLAQKMLALQEKLRLKRDNNALSYISTVSYVPTRASDPVKPVPIAIPPPQHSIATSLVSKKLKKIHQDPTPDKRDTSYVAPNEDDEDDAYQSDASFKFRTKSSRKPTKSKVQVFRDTQQESVNPDLQSPRTRQILSIINTRDLAQIKLLKGVGAKKAEAIVNCLVEMDGNGMIGVTTLEELGGLRGVGFKTVENMRSGIVG
ncbi:kinesin family member 22 [Patellaria atrata CBS 101060]|uniref:Kinesin family member 22 n=1 Tax=Patellaria atrata CBS 101060 TaxID=1346257 RepID=A0A9P4S2G7_9PEZI|nr:kinesin family member 22 [Patellaria atrata CBS 101060]